MLHNQKMPQNKCVYLLLGRMTQIEGVDLGMRLLKQQSNIFINIYNSAGSNSTQSTAKFLWNSLNQIQFSLNIMEGRQLHQKSVVSPVKRILQARVSPRSLWAVKASPIKNKVHNIINAKKCKREQFESRQSETTQANTLSKRKPLPLDNTEERTQLINLRPAFKTTPSKREVPFKLNFNSKQVLPRTHLKEVSNLVSPIKSRLLPKKELGDCPLIKQQQNTTAPQACEQEEEEDPQESSQWTLLESDGEQEQNDDEASSQASMVGALSILISPIKMITQLINPEEEEGVQPEEDGEQQDSNGMDKQHTISDSHL